jgi:hypothetical protein
VVEDGVGKRGIEGVIWEWQFVDIADLEADIGEAAFCRDGSRAFYVARAAIDAHHLAGSYHLCQPERHGAGATPTIQKAHASTEVREKEGSLTGRGSARIILGRGCAIA